MNELEWKPACVPSKGYIDPKSKYCSLYGRLLGQVVQTLLDLALWVNLKSPVTYKLDDIPMVSWLLGLLSLVLVVIINEIVKLHEIR